MEISLGTTPLSLSSEHQDTNIRISEDSSPVVFTDFLQAGSTTRWRVELNERGHNNVSSLVTSITPMEGVGPSQIEILITPTPFFTMNIFEECDEPTFIDFGVQDLDDESNYTGRFLQLFATEDPCR